MSLWFRRTRGLGSELMREIADNAGVGWDAQAIVYKRNGIGYAEGDATDAAAIQDAAESLLGYRPVEIDEPPQPTQE